MPQHDPNSPHAIPLPIPTEYRAIDKAKVMCFGLRLLRSCFVLNTEGYGRISRVQGSPELSQLSLSSSNPSSGTNSLTSYALVRDLLTSEG
ncbi:hypothetical protein QBC32DRAFT_369719 [Pseudoneurospora amorphoporcata]|uniref:Uncharacterized protein n=1 Tax=Pseudoneurospora amorphoporcata TaxID=241081 RepID=A0AAN6NY16_9PEZI|nr:hypothetical protein QBC32DRAFT_369719 [Pseudoneurospora amorphoporcata]